MDKPDEKTDRLLRQAFACRLQLIAYARSLLGNYSTAEDAVQEAMLVVVRKIDQFQEGTSMLAWCRAIVRLEVLKALQKTQRERTIASRLLDDAVDAAFEEFHDVYSDAQSDSWREALERCQQQLPDQARRVISARFVDELGYQQIADRIGISLEAVRKTLFRMKKQLRSCVESRLRGAL